MKVWACPLISASSDGPPVSASLSKAAFGRDRELSVVSESKRRNQPAAQWLGVLTARGPRHCPHHPLHRFGEKCQSPHMRGPGWAEWSWATEARPMCGHDPSVRAQEGPALPLGAASRGPTRSM